LAGTDRYAKCLRVIGQDLSSLRPEFLEVRLIKDMFVGCCCSALPDEDLRPRGIANLRKRGRAKSLFFLEAAQTPEPCSWVEFRYTPGDIERINQAWRTERGKAKKPDIHSLSELLRTAAYVDSDEDCLLKIIKENQRLTLYFQDLKEGTVKIREYSLWALYRRQQAMLSTREREAAYGNGAHARRR
jgi:hypothetical protein